MHLIIPRISKEDRIFRVDKSAIRAPLLGGREEKAGGAVIFVKSGVARWKFEKFRTMLPSSSSSPPPPAPSPPY